VVSLSAFYAADYQRFFEVFYAQARKAQACERTGDATLFLRIHGSSGVDGEIAEAVAEETERLALQKPGCMLQASAELTDAELDGLASYLRHPLFSSREEIEAALRSARDPKVDGPLLIRLGKTR